MGPIHTYMMMGADLCYLLAGKGTAVALERSDGELTMRRSRCRGIAAHMAGEVLNPGGMVSEFLFRQVVFHGHKVRARVTDADRRDCAHKGGSCGQEGDEAA